MMFSPGTKLITGELDGELQFVITRTRGWTDYAPIAALALFVLLIIPNHLLWGVCIAVIGGVAAYANWAGGNKGSVTSLRVTRDGFTPGGNLSKTFTSAITIPVARITSVSWNPGRENEPSGLYVWEGWSGRCVLADVGQEQAKAIREAIARKFPEIPLGEEGPLPMLSERAIGISPVDLEPFSFERRTGT